MAVPTSHGSRAPAVAPVAPAAPPPPAALSRLVWVGVALLTVFGAAARVDGARQSLFGDELSTYWLTSEFGLFGMVETIHESIEITPPFSFVLAWLTTRIDMTPELLRAPALLAGVATIPLVYVLGARTVGRLPALVAAAIVACSPFLIFYSSEARGYQVMVLLLVLSTLALLRALETGRGRGWAAYAVCSCLAVYSHYTAVFVLAGQALWALWCYPQARRAVLVANVAAAAAFAPWVSGMVNDFQSPDQKLMDLITPFTAFQVRLTLEHWSVGYPLVQPTTELRDLPGIPGLALMALGLAVGIVGAATRFARGARPERRAVLIAILAVATPAGTLAASVINNPIFVPRNLAASWPGFALALAAVLVVAGRRPRLVGLACVLAGFAIAGVKMFGDGFQRPDFRAAAAFVDRESAPGEPVIDGAVLFFTPGPVTPLDATLERPHPTMRAGASERREGNFRPTDPVLTSEQLVARVTSERRRAFVVVPEVGDVSSATFWDPLFADGRIPYRRIGRRVFDAYIPLAVFTYAPAR